MFHVKHFGAIDTSRKQTFAKRWKIRARDLAQARYRDRIYDGELCPKAKPSSRGGLQGRLEGCAARVPGAPLQSPFETLASQAPRGEGLGFGTGLLIFIDI
jgi:hypothetical protein